MNAALGNSMNKLSAVAKKVTQGETFMKLDKIYTSSQVRTTFRNLDELAENFKLNGIIEPLVIHQEPDGRHRLIIGERRFRAAPLAGLDQVPVVIKRGLTQQQIRALQVAENEVRDDLTAYEKAMGVIEDVDNFGVKEAMKIWNSSEGWVSKRVAVKRYLPITLSILSDELSGDLEILLTINKIEQLDSSVASEYRKQLERDEPLHRDAVRSRLNMMELQRKESEQRQQQEKNATVAQLDEGAQDTDAGSAGKAPDVAIKEVRTTALAKTDTEQGKGATTTKLHAKPKTAPHPDAEAAAAREMTIKGERLYALRKELFDYGRDNESYFKKMQELMFELKHSSEDGEWILWTGFLDMALPMLERLGADRSKAYLKRLQLELKGKTPAAMWADLHPSCALDDPSKEGTAVPDKPKGWKF